MEHLKGTKTEANLRTAFSGESQARNKYSYFSEIAAMEGYNEIAKFFGDAANHEMHHAKAWYKLLNGNMFSTTKENLAAAIEGERFERTDMYPIFAKIAKEEGFDSIAFLFEEIGKIERKHEEQYSRFLQSLSDGTTMPHFENDMSCLSCGHEFREDEHLEKCPVCGMSVAFFVHK